MNNINTCSNCGPPVLSELPSTLHTATLAWLVCRWIYCIVLVYLGYFYGSQLKSSPLVSRTFVIYLKLLLFYLRDIHPEAASSAHVTAPASSEHQVPAIRTHAGVGDVQVLGPDGAIVTLRADVERGSYQAYI